jgi:hypothetical protein
VTGLFPTRALKPGYSSGLEPKIASVQEGCIDLGAGEQGGVKREGSLSTI